MLSEFCCIPACAHCCYALDSCDALQELILTENSLAVRVCDNITSSLIVLIILYVHNTTSSSC